jgi:hypothetical protein
LHLHYFFFRAFLKKESSNDGVAKDTMADRHVFDSVADRSGICFFDPGIRDGKNTDPGSEMNISDLIVENLVPA